MCIPKLQIDQSYENSVQSLIIVYSISNSVFINVQTFCISHDYVIHNLLDPGKASFIDCETCHVYLKKNGYPHFRVLIQVSHVHLVVAKTLYGYVCI